MAIDVKTIYKNMIHRSAISFAKGGDALWLMKHEYAAMPFAKGNSLQ